MKTHDEYRITAVRLVEFHNLGTTTIDINDGGHLFLLGDNGSGKTTLLDAIHLVLTGGREMELNSAARVAGSKDSGRSMQGIVLRYNAATGRPFRETGITYAAIELRSDLGKILSLAVGISAQAMDVAFERWGGLAPVPVGELPLTIEEDGHLRTATQAEFKRLISSLNGGHHYAHISDYCNAVASRVFGNETKYADVCHLLRTGKAYREIAARATNYDELFRQLLEEPSRETFEPLLKGLRELEESEGKFNELDARADYLSKLRQEQAKLSTLRLKTQLVTWFESESRRKVIERETAEISAAIDNGKRESEELERNAATVADSINDARNRLAALRAKDATGLIGREKEASARLATAERLAAEAAAELATVGKVAASAEIVLKSARSERATDLSRSADEILRLAKNCPISVGALADVLRNVDQDAADGGQETFDNVFYPLRDEIATERDKASREAMLAEQNVVICKNAVSEKRAALEEIRGRGDNLPNTSGFAETRAAVRTSMLKAKPAYELLEPASGCDSKHLALIESIAGDDFLATWLVDSSDADALRRILYQTDGKGTLAIRDEIAADERTIAWLGRYVSYEESDVDAVRLLASHISSAGCPTESEFLGHATWMFRNREGLMPTPHPRLIGLKARQAEQARLEREASKALASCESELKAAEKNATTRNSELTAVKVLEKAVFEARTLASRTAASLMALQAEWIRAEERRTLVTRLSKEKKDSAVAARTELEDIRIRMRPEGIDDKLERRIGETERQIASAEKRKGDIERRIGAVRGQLESLFIVARKARARYCEHDKEVRRNRKVSGGIRPSGNGVC